MTFKLLPITWQTFSTIGTFLAVLVAIFLPSWRDRRRLNLNLRIGQMITFGEPPTPHLRTYNDPSPRFIRDPELPFLVVLTVINAGRDPIVIDGWEMRSTNLSEGDESMYIKPERLSLPIELAHAKEAHLISSNRETFGALPYLTEAWVTDTLGKKWRVPKVHIRRIRAFKGSAESSESVRQKA